MNFDFYTASKIIFGSGQIKRIGDLSKTLGKIALFVVGGGSYDFNPIIDTLEKHNVELVKFSIAREPDVYLINEGIRLARSNACDFVVAIGGGSVIDAGKAISAMLTNQGELTDYMEIIGSGKKISFKASPFLAVPTTAGTGSEVTKNAVIKVPEQQVKVSIRSELIIPTIALVDPDLSQTVPPDVTASTGMDAFTQVVEPYVSKRANPFTDMLCEAGIRTGPRALIEAFKNGTDLQARQKVSHMSLMGGMALANAGLGAVHGFAGPIGGMFDVPHGVICACLLPHVIKSNVNAMLHREPDSAALNKYKQISEMITGNEKSSIKDLIDWTFDLCETLNIPKMSELGIERKNFGMIIEKVGKSSSMKGNPIPLEDQELLNILEQAF